MQNNNYRSSCISEGNTTSEFQQKVVQAYIASITPFKLIVLAFIGLDLNIAGADEKQERRLFSLGDQSTNAGLDLPFRWCGPKHTRSPNENGNGLAY